MKWYAEQIKNELSAVTGRGEERMKRLNELLSTGAIEARWKLQLKEGEEKEMVLEGLEMKEGRWGQYALLYLREQETGKAYYLTTGSARNIEVLGKLVELLMKGEVQLPILVTIRGGKQSALIS